MRLISIEILGLENFWSLLITFKRDQISKASCPTLLSNQTYRPTSHLGKSSLKSRVTSKTLLISLEVSLTFVSIESAHIFWLLLRRIWTSKMTRSSSRSSRIVSSWRITRSILWVSNKRKKRFSRLVDHLIRSTAQQSSTNSWERLRLSLKNSLAQARSWML